MSDDEQLYQIGRRARQGPPAHWRSLDELYQTPIYQELLRHGELPPIDKSSDPSGVSRRGFLQLLGASMALAGLDGCGRDVPPKILPYSIHPEGVQPGVPQYYATAMMLDGFATGLLVKSVDGRPIKVEGNPAHPSSRGATSLFHQASVLEVYDPDRARRVRNRFEPSSWDALEKELWQSRPDGGASLRLLLQPTTSPTAHRLLAAVKARLPQVKVTFYSPLSSVNGALRATQLAFGRELQPRFDFAHADVVLSLDSDFLGNGPEMLAHAADWASRRRATEPGQTPSRMYVVECMPSVTGFAADHRWRRRSSEVYPFAAAVAAALPGLGALKGAMPTASDADRTVAQAIARDLSSRPAGTTLVVAGERQPPAVQALAYAMNAALGNLGRTVRFSLPVPGIVAGDQDLAALVDEMQAGQVDTLLMLDGNPVYDAPDDLPFDRALDRVRERIRIGGYEDETAPRCTWTAPLSHFLESWGDGLAWDGTLSIVQPLIRPMRGGKSVIEVLALLAGDRTPDGLKLVQATHPQLDWDATLQAGLAKGTALPEVMPPAVQADAIAHALESVAPPSTGYEINFLPSPTLYDGRFANNPWLLEQPEPITKLTWDNALLVSPATATKLGVHTQDLVQVQIDGRAALVPALVVPGHADDAASMWLGWGRQGAQSLARGRGVSAYRLRTTKTLAYAGEGILKKVPGTHVLATTQIHFNMHGRPIALSTTADEYRRDPTALTEDHKGEEPSLMKPVEALKHGNQWAMSIDMTVCTGCSACMLACQSENNLLVVGKEGVVHHREMHWLRIDTYFEGSVENPSAIHQPMMCQHCETAPCEYVCPVNATVHSDDGLNEMVYNRCVGTRFCSNNCPYKVRRFNFFNWTKREPAYNAGSFELVHNPDVTVRDRGVMEKCTYCVQRIRETEITAQNERRELRSGEVRTACQQACPTGAIQFGSLAHQDTPMVKMRQQHRGYAVLHDMGTRPRTMYLARIDNPNPDLSK